MPIVQTQPDGLHLLPYASLQQLAKDETLLLFANGLLPQALAQADLPGAPELSLAEALHQPTPDLGRALLAGLMALDAEVHLEVADKVRVLPLPGFLSYRSQLPLAKFPPKLIRLPPLNPGGHYFFSRIEPDRFMAVRLDFHPGEQLAGHVRVVISRPDQSPQRLMPVEYRLERQVLNEPMIQAAIGAGQTGLSEPMTGAEEATLKRILGELIGIETYRKD